MVTEGRDDGGNLQAERSYTVSELQPAISSKVAKFYALRVSGVLVRVTPLEFHLDVWHQKTACAGVFIMLKLVQ